MEVITVLTMRELEETTGTTNYRTKNRFSAKISRPKAQNQPRMKANMQEPKRGSPSKPACSAYNLRGHQVNLERVHRYTKQMYT